MGRWGTGIFEDDDSSDWVYELEEQGLEAGIKSTLAALTKEIQGDILEMPACEVAAALGSICAMLLGMPRLTTITPELDDLLSQAAYRPDSATVKTCIRVLDFTLGDKAEINDEGVWGDAEDHAAWRAEVSAVRDYLAAQIA